MVYQNKINKYGRIKYYFIVPCFVIEHLINYNNLKLSKRLKGHMLKLLSKLLTKRSKKSVQSGSFENLGLSENILLALKKLGYEKMTPIQEQSFPMIASGKDLCALAETGSGKTAACSIPLIQKIDPNLNSIQGLVIVPTRELCLQYVTEIMNISEFTKVVPFAIYGGAEKSIQIAKIKHEVHILVATPGRLIDLIYDGVITLSDIKCLILDEADELLNEGFLDDIKFIMSCIIHEHQTLMFSATMPDEIKQLADECLKNPEYISLIDENPTPKSIEHLFKFVPHNRKQIELMEILNNEKINQAIIFCNSRTTVDRTFRSFRNKINGLEYIHGGLSQDVRSSIFWKFKKGKIRFLFTTDVTGRGVDFTNVSHVINWDFPVALEQYTHRTGRSGRMGRKGIAITFITKYDLIGVSKLINTKNISPIWLGKNPLLDKVPDKFQNRKKKVHSKYNKYSKSNKNHNVSSKDQKPKG